MYIITFNHNIFFHAKTFTYCLIGLSINCRCNNWHFMEDGCVPNQILKRGMTREVLPHYPYRDDTEDLFEIIKRYVDATLSYYYGNMFVINYKSWKCTVDG